MSLKKAELQDLFQFLSQNLNPTVKSQILKTTGRGGQSASRDYISANCLLSEVRKVVGEDYDFSTIQNEKELWDLLHPATKFRLRAFTPCLAARYDELKDDAKNRCFEDRDWIATEKQNGCRGWLINYKGKCFLYSRNYSDVDCSLPEYWSNIYQSPVNIDEIYAIDVEVKFEPGVDIRPDLQRLGLETDSPLEAMVAMLHTHAEDAINIQKKFKEIHGKDLIVFRLIAPLYFKGRNYLNKTLGEGMDVYNECVEFGQSIGLNVKPIDRCAGSREEKEIFLNTILEAGGEGVVFHYRKGSYCTSENRSKTSFIKLKRSVKSTMAGEGMGDTIDGWVSGFKVGSNGTANEGLISAFQITCIVKNGDHQYEHVIAVVPNLDLETKKLATIDGPDGLYPQEVVLSDGTTKWISLNPEFDKLVYECDGQALSAVSRRLEHPRLLRPRFDKSWNECIYTQEFLDSQTTNAGISYATK